MMAVGGEGHSQHADSNKLRACAVGMLLLLTSLPVSLAAQTETATGATQESQTEGSSVAALPSGNAVTDRPTLVEKLREQKASSPRQPTSDYGTVLTGLLATLSLVFVLAWVARKLRARVPGLSADMRLEEVLALGPREKVCIVRLGEKRLMLGVTQHSINVLQTMEAGEGKNSEDGAFSEKIKKMLQNGIPDGR